MTITVYHVIQETKKIIKTDKYTELDMDLSAGEEYTIDIVSDEIDYEENTYYFLFALKNGSVIPYAAKETPSGIDTTFTGVAMDDEVKDTWIMYYSSVKSDPWGTLEKAVMSTEKSNARLKFGDSLSTISTVVEESEDTEIFSIAIDTGFMSDSFFTYGSSYSPSCEVDMSKCQYAKQGKFFTVEFEIDGIWMDFGTFYINSVPKKTSEYIHFTGSGLLDSVLSKNDGNVYFHNETLPGMISRIKNVWGVTVIIEFEDELKSVEDGTYWENSKIITIYERIENESGSVGYKDITFSPREYLSQVAVALHANVIERNGIIYLQRADNHPVYLKFDEDCYNSEPEVDMSIRYAPSPVKTSCKQSAVNLLTSESLTPYYLDKDNVEAELNIAKPVTGNDSDIELVYYPLTIDCDPLWALTTDISEKYWGNLGKYPFKTMAGRTTSPVYMPIELEFSGYNPCIYAGSNVYVEVNGEMAPFLIGNVSISWDGGFTMSVTTPCDIQLDQNTSSTVGNSSSAGSGTKVTNPDIYKNLLIDKELDEVSENAIANKAVSIPINMFLKDYYYKEIKQGYDVETGDYSLFVDKDVIRNKIDSSSTVDTSGMWRFFELENGLIFFKTSSSINGNNWFYTEDGFSTIFDAYELFPISSVYIGSNAKYVNGYLIMSSDNSIIYYTKDGYNWQKNKIGTQINVNDIVYVNGIWFCGNLYARSLGDEFEKIVQESELYDEDGNEFTSVYGIRDSLPSGDVVYILDCNYYSTSRYLYYIKSDLSFEREKVSVDGVSSYYTYIGIYGKYVAYRLSTSNPVYLNVIDIDTKKRTTIVGRGNRRYDTVDVVSKDFKNFYAMEVSSSSPTLYSISMEDLSYTVPESVWLNRTDKLYKQSGNLVYYQTPNITEKYKPVFTVPYTQKEKSKLSCIEDGAEVNVQSDWSEADDKSDSFIKNKPEVTEETIDIDFSNYFS